MQSLGPEKEIEASTKKLLRGWLPKQSGLFDAGTAAALVQLNNFASSIRNQRFEKVVKTILSGGATTGPTIETVIRIGDALGAGSSNGTSDLLKKSLQETLFLIGDFDFDQRSFGTNAQAFVREGGCRGLIQLFLELHLSNLIWKQLNNSLKVPLDHEALEKLPKGIQLLCQQAVYATTASWKKWPDLDDVSAARLLRSLRSEMIDILNDPPASLQKAG